MTTIDVVLAGGPSSLPEGDRIRTVSSLADKIKLPIGNGYEHFAYSGEYQNFQGSRMPAFTWCGRTKIAE
jgi:hypothetical protein